METAVGGAGKMKNPRPLDGHSRQPRNRKGRKRLLDRSRNPADFGEPGPAGCQVNDQAEPVIFNVANGSPKLHPKSW